MPDHSLLAKLDAFYKGLDNYQLATADMDPGDSDEIRLARKDVQRRETARLGGLIREMCFTEPGIGSSQLAGRAALTPAQLEPARQFRQWLVSTLAATDWTNTTQTHRARVLWLEVLDNPAFGYQKLAELLPDEESGLAPVLDKMLQKPYYQFDEKVFLRTLLYKIVELDMQFPGPAREAMRLRLPRLLRFGPGSKGRLDDLALHPEATEEVPRLLHDIFAQPALAHYQRHVEDWLAKAPVVAVLGPALPRLRHYLGRLTQPQLAELLKCLSIAVLADESRVINRRLDSYAESPNRLGLLALLAQLATAPALAALTQAALARVQARQQELAQEARQRQQAAQLAQATPPGQLADFKLKLLVVSQLLRQGVVFKELAATLARAPDFDDFSYAPIPAALRAYRHLRLTPAHYDQVTTLAPDAGDIHDLHLINNWDGEDEQFDVYSLDGIGLLRNLRVFTPTSLVTEVDFTPLLDCPQLEEAAIADLAGADSAVARQLEARGVRVT